MGAMFAAKSPLGVPGLINHMNKKSDNPLPGALPISAADGARKLMADDPAKRARRAASGPLSITSQRLLGE